MEKGRTSKYHPYIPPKACKYNQEASKIASSLIEKEFSRFETVKEKHASLLKEIEALHKEVFATTNELLGVVDSTTADQLVRLEINAKAMKSLRRFTKWANGIKEINKRIESETKSILAPLKDTVSFMNPNKEKKEEWDAILEGLLAKLAVIKKQTSMDALPLCIKCEKGVAKYIVNTTCLPNTGSVKLLLCHCQVANVYCGKCIKQLVFESIEEGSQYVDCTNCSGKFGISSLQKLEFEMNESELSECFDRD